jgi:hypothetical protein
MKLWSSVLSTFHKFLVTWLARLIITTTQSAKQKSIKFLCVFVCVWEREWDSLWKWTHAVDFSNWLCCKTCPFFQKTPLRENSVSPCWDHLLFHNSAFSQMNATALNVLQQSTAIQTAERACTHTHTCTLGAGQHQNYVTCWTFPNKSQDNMTQNMSHSAIKQGSSFSVILYRECCNIYCLNKSQNRILNSYSKWFRYRVLLRYRQLYMQELNFMVIMMSNFRKLDEHWLTDY